MQIEKPTSWVQIVRLERDSTQIAQDPHLKVDLAWVGDSLLIIHQIAIDHNLTKEFRGHSIELRSHNKSKIPL